MEFYDDLTDTAVHIDEDGDLYVYNETDGLYISVAKLDDFRRWLNNQVS